ncbi:response regulator transcription factor [Pilimelia columellifera]|uniref:HTH luxR-type domain-containing protein n=1 Tax=Pilimelia columellifera subsp. columellifera TaxID=706583 RepID=A0ABP6B4Z7_9ACTN
MANLTDRERQVLTAMAEGLSNNAIAARLHLSEGGIEKHISALFGKLKLAAAPDINRRVLAVTAYLRNAAIHHP